MTKLIKRITAPLLSLVFLLNMSGAGMAETTVSAEHVSIKCKSPALSSASVTRVSPITSGWFLARVILGTSLPRGHGVQ